MADHIMNRDAVIKALREELVGPSPQGEEIDCSQDVVFDEAAKAFGPWRQKGSGDEILLRDPPRRRYGIGVLYAMDTPVEDTEGVAQPEENMVVPDDNGQYSAAEVLSSEGFKSIEKIGKRIQYGEPEPDDFDLSNTNTYRPSSIGVSFFAEFPEESKLVVEVPRIHPVRGCAVNGRYVKKLVKVGDKEYTWWLRQSVSMTAVFSSEDICGDGATEVRRIPASELTEDNVNGLDLRIEMFSRKLSLGESRQRLVTVCLVNRARGGDECFLFQYFLKASVVTGSGEACILPYPGKLPEELDDEEQSLALLYRRVQTFAVGHGCAADWEESDRTDRARAVYLECIPVFQAPSTTPDITREDGTPINVPMAPLAGLVKDDDGFDSLQELVSAYEEWIEAKRREIPLLAPRYRAAAERHMKDCSKSAERMRKGLEYLSDDKAKLAFQFANRAMLLQQARSRRLRLCEFDPKTARYVFSEEYSDPEAQDLGETGGKWRAFQIAFILMTVCSAAEGDAPDRETVDLVWFPTGGGKTEAYLGLAAFAMFMRRLKDPADAGVHVLMRYTLRLLTAQQFQRAASLLCAMEHIRQENVDKLGEEEFSIGLWLGSSTTPNTREEARQCLLALIRGDRLAQNKFILDRCPWCGAQMGPIEPKRKRSRGSAQRVVGYERRGKTVALTCSDPACKFSRGLPVYVIDEDIYERKPSLVIGTVDKFAMLAWRPEARALFGINTDGIREVSPPGLIIQDELHLISGPLGSMAGLYETVIEALCTDSRSVPATKPKIVCSTATIRRYQDQVKSLYARTDVKLFPASGLDIEDSFFARYARDRAGHLCPGRVYVGIHAPGLGSMQTAQVRAFTSLLQAPVALPPNERDPWWTLLVFFNSLRELGTTLSLFQSDIPDYFKVIRNRTGLPWNSIRKLHNIMELTSRLREDEVPEAISALEVKCGGKKRPVDACLASNIIEVGIDIDRLSLMAVVGQPKTTSQYIQVTGRVGRLWQERPGLVVTLYSPSKPRDRSHFEKFRSYHECLYAQVEPTSVTPFSPPVLDRALHAALVSYARQAGDSSLAQSPYPYPKEIIDAAERLFADRIMAVDPEEIENFERVYTKRKTEWLRWERTVWKGNPSSEEIPLLREAGTYATRERARVSWATPMSMRNVDAECLATITELYLNEGREDEENG